MTTDTPAKNTETVCLRIDAEAKRLLRAAVPTPLGMGRLMSRIVFEHFARAEAQQEIFRLYGLPAKTEDVEK